jgi:flagellar hook-associated protein 3 FlgL
MISTLPVEYLNSNTYAKVLQVAGEVAGKSTAQVSNLQSTLGNSQERITSANSRMAIQQDIMNKSITNMETVNQYEAATRATELMNQLNTAYALTAKIQNLSILNYIS